MYKDKERAKAIIMEIIRQAGGQFHNKTNLFKAFYYAHLEFARTQPGFLSTWPIVRMPNGPGIDRFDRLLGELMAEGKLEIQPITKGSYEGFLFSTAGTGDPDVLPDGSADAIAKAVSMVDGKTARTVSKESHRRAWKSAKDGQEMNIYLDLDNSNATIEADAAMVGDLFRQIWPV
jgi:hypothetical protein